MKPNHVPESQRTKYHYHQFIKYLIKHGKVSKEYADAAYQTTCKGEFPLTEAWIYVREYL